MDNSAPTMKSDALKRLLKKPTLKNRCLYVVGQLVTSGKLPLPELQILGYDILDQLYHHIHCAKQLTSLELINALVTPYLHTLSLSLCFNLTDSQFETILQKCEHLHAVNISACHGITNKGVEMVGKYCPELESLNIANGHTITESAVSLLLTTTLSFLIDVDTNSSEELPQCSFFQFCVLLGVRWYLLIQALVFLLI